MKEYLDTLQHVMTNGTVREDRTGVGTRSVFGHQMRIDLRKGFPLLTTKRAPFRWVAAELIWFLSGDTNAKTLQEQGVTIWDEWATAEQCAKFRREAGDLGPIYGRQWRNFGEFECSGFSVRGFDQIAWLERELVANPFSRRLVCSAWNPEDAQRVALPPCHTLFQFYVSRSHDGSMGELSCHLYARSIDAFLGLPFNIASYALLTHAFAHVTCMGVGELIISFGDLHLYSNHVKQAREQLSRQPRPLPKLVISRPREHGIFGFASGDFALDGYDPQPAIKAEVAV